MRKRKGKFERHEVGNSSYSIFLLDKKEEEKQRIKGRIHLCVCVCVRGR